MRRAFIVVASAAALATTAPSTAAAHVQIAPTIVAPDDPVKFTVLVPGERESETTKVAVKMPAGLLPFSYEATPGWRRGLVKAPNGSVEQIVWTGRLARDGFVEFSFLAGTPPHLGDLSFKAVQTYSDGTVVRWIEAPDTEHPAPVAHIVAGAPRQNAGGEGKQTGAPPDGTETSSGRTPAAAGTTDWTARITGFLALIASCVLAYTFVHRRRSDGRIG